MKLENRCMVPADAGATWDFLMDIPQAASCVPGLGEVTPEGEGLYRGVLKVRVGPMGLNLSGSIRLLSQDPEKREAQLLVEASDRRVGGTVRTHLDVRLSPQGEAQTELVVYSDTTLMGRLGEMGQPIIRRKAASTVQEFGHNLAQRVNAAC